MKPSRIFSSHHHIDSFGEDQFIFYIFYSVGERFDSQVAFFIFFKRLIRVSLQNRKKILIRVAKKKNSDDECDLLQILTT
jgi:hypothetical protein